jgi:outer membrane autotransporter protein
VRFERAFDPQEPGAGSFELRAIWRHEFRDVNPTFSARMTGAPTAVSFTVAGASLQRDSLVAGGGASGKIAKDISLYGDYNLELRGSQRTHAVVGGLRYSF